ncbi:MAG: hypothetical protein E6G28_00550 [Actinobacteria bacterium]|nr:MAG: hypothetical protein E6G28_00550 [Actinomycetota bacterium]
MKTKVAALSPRVLVALAVAGVLLWAALAWLLYVSPHRSEASRLDEQLAAARVELAQAQVAAHHPASAGAPVADVFRLATAMPASSDQAGLVLELSRLAAGSGVTLRSITSDSSAAGDPRHGHGWRQVRPDRPVPRARALPRRRAPREADRDRKTSLSGERRARGVADRRFPEARRDDRLRRLRVRRADRPRDAADDWGPEPERVDYALRERRRNRSHGLMQSADRAARERKQKIFVAVGGLLLLALLAFELPHYLGGSSGSSSTPPTTTTADASAASGTTPQAAASTPAATTTSAPVSLAGASRPPAPGPGQLSSFSKFPGKDPFVQQVSWEHADRARDGDLRQRRQAGARARNGFPVREPGLRSRLRTAEDEECRGRGGRRRLRQRREDDEARRRQASRARQHDDRRPLQARARRGGERPGGAEDDAEDLRLGKGQRDHPVHAVAKTF